MRCMQFSAWKEPRWKEARSSKLAVIRDDCVEAERGSVFDERWNEEI